MYKISFYRWQVKKPYGKENRGEKGIFTKDFNTLDELAKFLINTGRNNIFCTDLKNEIGGKQNLHILGRKLHVLHDKKYNIVRCKKCGRRLGDCENEWLSCQCDKEVSV